VACELPLHVSEVPEVEPRGDCIYVCWRGLEFYLPIPVAQAYVGRFHRALDEVYEARGGSVVPFRPTAVAAE
jgi:hypothetical protein